MMRVRIPLRWLPAYALALALFGQAGKVAFERREIDPAPPKNPWIKVVGDFDGDKRLDVAIGGQKGPLVLYRGPNWEKSVVAQGGYESVDGEAADIDGDGDLDLVIGGVLWYENPRGKAGPFTREWTAHRIGTHRTHDVEVADLDRDGKPEVIVRGQTGFKHNEGHRILIFKQNSADDWRSRELACPEGEGLELADLDRDGDMDIVIGARWFENTGKGIDAAWPEHVYAKTWTYGDAKVAVGDLSGDRKLDIALAPAEYQGGSYRMAWFEAPADPKSGAWREHLLEASVESVVHGMDVGDVDGDKRADLVAAKMHQGAAPQEVAVYWNGGRGGKWIKQVLSTRGSHNILLADLDGDGSFDILGANHGGAYQPVEWWKKR